MILVLVSIVAALLLQLSGVSLLSLEDIQTTGNGTPINIMMFLKLHWAFLALSLTTLLGALLAMRPKR